MASSPLPPFNPPFFLSYFLQLLPLSDQLPLYAIFSGISTVFLTTMKLTISIPNPKKLFLSRKSRRVSRSTPSSFASHTTSSSASSSSSSIDASSIHKSSKSATTPTSVIPSRSQEISEYLSDISVEMLSELAQAFRLIDREGDGKISVSDLEALLVRVGGDPPSQEELLTMLRVVDRDGDGSISLENFMAIRSAFEPSCDSAELRETFDFFDTDHDGKVTAEELFRVFTTLGDDRITLCDCRRMIAEVDKNKDGFVCFEDFTLMMEQQR